MARSGLIFGVFLGVLVACGSSYEGESAPAGIVFQKNVSPFEGFAYETGPLPSKGPAQLSLSATAGGALAIEAKGHAEGEKLTGDAQGGKLTLDAKLALEGTMKLDLGAAKYDGEIPGLKNVSIPIAGNVGFDPFLVGKSIEVVASIPKTELPPIPVGTTPAKLHLTVTDASEVRVGFRGACVRVAGNKATWQGVLAPKGTIVLKGTIKVDLPGIAPVDLGEIKVPITLGEKPLEIPANASVAMDDVTEGQCGAPVTPAGDASVDASPDDASTTPPEDPLPPIKDGGSDVACVPGTCPGTNLGTIRGDIGADTKTFTGKGSQWVQVHVDEGTKDSLPLRIRVDIEPKGLPGAIYIKSYASKSCSMAANVSAGTDTATSTWPDVAGMEDARDFVVLVEKPCQSWTLTVHR